MKNFDVSSPQPGLGIAAKVALVLLGTNLVAVLATGLLYYYRHQDQIVTTIEKHLKSVAQQESHLVLQILQKHKEHVGLLASQLQQSMAMQVKTRETSTIGGNTKQNTLDDMFLRQKLQHFKDMIPNVSAVHITDLTGRVLVSTLPLSNKYPLPIQQLALQHPFDQVQVNVHSSVAGENYLILTNTMYQDDRPIAVVVAEITLSELASLVNRHIGLGYTEETMLLYRSPAGQVLPLVPLKFESDSAVIPAINPFQYTNDQSRISRKYDYRGHEVFAITQVLPDFDWALVFKIDVDDAMSVVKEQQTFLLLSMLGSAFIVLLISLLFSRTLTKPVTNFIQVAQMIASGDLTQRIKWTSKDEVGMLAGAFNRMADKLIRVNEELDNRVKDKTKELAKTNERLAKANRDLERVTLEDSLTRIGNRRAFDQAMRREWKRCLRDGNPLPLLIVDVDYFKNYNDTLGHNAGDDCLIHIATLLDRIVQRDGDLVARYGGEEFAILLPNTTKIDCEKLAHCIVQVMNQEQLPHPASPISGFVTLSVGYGTYLPALKVSSVQFIKSIDQALYAAKRQGRNRAAQATLPRESKALRVNNISKLA